MTVWWDHNVGGEINNILDSSGVDFNTGLLPVKKPSFFVKPILSSCDSVEQEQETYKGESYHVRIYVSVIFNTPASASEDEASTAHQCWSIDSLSCRFQEWEQTDLWCHSYSEGRHFLFYVRMPLHGDWWLCIYIHLFVSSRDQTSHQPESVVKASLWRAGLQQMFYLHCWWILSFYFFSTTWLFVFKCPPKGENLHLTISQRRRRSFFLNPCFDSPTLQKLKKDIKQKSSSSRS